MFHVRFDGVANDTAAFPWMSPEVIAEWMRQRRQRVMVMDGQIGENSISIDDYDGPESFAEEGHRVPRNLAFTQELSPTAMRLFRAECIHMERMELQPGSNIWEAGIRQAISAAHRLDRHEAKEEVTRNGATLSRVRPSLPSQRNQPQSLPSRRFVGMALWKTFRGESRITLRSPPLQTLTCSKTPQVAVGPSRTTRT